MCLTVSIIRSIEWGFPRCSRKYLYINIIYEYIVVSKQCRYSVYIYIYIKPYLSIIVSNLPSSIKDFSNNKCTNSYKYSCIINAIS